MVVVLVCGVEHAPSPGGQSSPRGNVTLKNDWQATALTTGEGLGGAEWGWVSGRVGLGEDVSDTYTPANPPASHHQGEA